MRAVLVLSMLALVAFAGCGSKEPAAATDVPLPTTIDGTGAPMPTNGSGPSPTATPTANHAPTAGVNVTGPSSGSVPLNATFTVTGTDPDGDTLSWTVAFGDGGKANGTVLPATIKHTFSKGGNFTVRLNVTDGKSSATATTLVTTHMAVLAPDQELELKWTTDGAGCGDAPASMMFGTPTDGVVWKQFDVDATTIGQPMTATGTATSPVFVFQVAYYGADDKVIEKFTGGPTLSGVVSAGAVHGLAVSCLGGANIVVEYAAGPGVPPPA
jgi:PKD repeat protein